MPTPNPPRAEAPRSKLWTCPNCALCVTLTHNRNGIAATYEMADWARRCPRAELSGPLTCPWGRRALQAWPVPDA